LDDTPDFVSGGLIFESLSGDSIFYLAFMDFSVPLDKYFDNNLI
jgi:hypothetical protein